MKTSDENMPPRIQNIQVPRIPSTSAVQLLPEPITTSIPAPIIQVPSASIPFYEPIDYIPEDKYYEPVEGVNTGSEEETEEGGDFSPSDLPPIPQGVPVVEVPIVGEVPIPAKEQVILAGTTAIAATAAALMGKKIVDTLVKILKPMVKIGITKAKAAILHQQLSDFEIQQVFAWELAHPEKVPKNLQKVAKSLKRDQRKELVRQKKADERRRRQRKSPHTVIEDET